MIWSSFAKATKIIKNSNKGSIFARYVVYAPFQKDLKKIAEANHFFIFPEGFKFI
jgi:hypothetical protein